MLSGFLFATSFAFLNRARGSKLFDLTTSTTVSRLASTFAMAALVMLASGDWLAAAWAWASLFLWAVPEWGKYLGAACGNPINEAEKGFVPSEWVVGLLPLRNSRTRGLIGTAVRMSLAVPCGVGIAYLTGGPMWPALLAPAMALPYFGLGLVLDSGRAWKYGEYGAGAVLGLLVCMAIGG